MTVGGVKFKVNSARFLASRRPVAFSQQGSQLVFSDLPSEAPDDSITVIAAECGSEPIQDALSSRADPPS